MYIRETEYNERKREQARISYASTLKMQHIISVVLNTIKIIATKLTYKSSHQHNLQICAHKLLSLAKNYKNKVFEFIFTCLREVAMISVSVKVWLDF